MKNNHTPAPTPGVQDAPHRLKLLVTVVNRSKAEFYSDFLQSFEVNFQTILAAEGTADNERRENRPEDVHQPKKASATRTDAIASFAYQVALISFA